MKKTIALIDFGAGNLHSVYKAFKFLGANINITKDPSSIERASAVVFPGVGAFGAAMQSIRKSNLQDVIVKSANSLKPFLGICIGMQVLFESSEESLQEVGLSILKGRVVKFKKAKKVPHIGWNDVTFSSRIVRTAECYPESKAKDLKTLVDCRVGAEAPLRNDVTHKFYFVHSYYVIPHDKDIVISKTEHENEKFVSVIQKENLFAVQFHPEKSGDIGLEFLKTFIERI